MDTGKGYFEQVEEKDIEKLRAAYDPIVSFFRVGEEIKIKNSLFRVKSIKPKELRLKLLKQERR